jgi:hypothetical protein
MAKDVSLAELLALLLDTPKGSPVFATPSFRPWLATDTPAPWPPSGDAGGLWLVDTRDRAGRALIHAWASGGARQGFDAALILSGSGAPGTPLRRLLRRVRRPGTRRLPERRVLPALRGVGAVTRLAFEDGPEVPADFSVDDAPSTGAAFLLTSKPPFDGETWSRIGNRLGDRDSVVQSIHLRVRGAAVARIRAGNAQFAIRIVPPGDLQDVVLRNHCALVRLRAALAGCESLLRRIPEPAFSDRHQGVLTLGESHLPGKPAWQVPSRALSDTIYRNAIAFLDALRDATTRFGPVGHGAVSELLDEDWARLRGATFVSRAIGGRIEAELENAAHVLAGQDLAIHASHGDFGYGNILVDEKSGEVTGVIDWDTARIADFPGIDRVNLEIQLRRSNSATGSLSDAMHAVWSSGSTRAALGGPGTESRIRALFGLAVCRYVLRSFSYPALYREEEEQFERALASLGRIGPCGSES